MLILLGVPLINLVYKAGIEIVQSEQGRIRSWSLTKCLRLVASSPVVFAEEFAWSMVLSQLTACESVLVFPWAWWARQRRRGPQSRLGGNPVRLIGPGPPDRLALGSSAPSRAPIGSSRFTTARCASPGWLW